MAYVTFQKKVRSLRFVLISISLLLLSAMADDATSVPSPQPTTGDITYCSVSGVELGMDLYLPHNVGEIRRPLVVYVHGGGWVGGDKRDGAGFLDVSNLLLRG